MSQSPSLKKRVRIQSESREQSKNEATGIVLDVITQTPPPIRAVSLVTPNLSLTPAFPNRADSLTAPPTPPVFPNRAVSPTAPATPAFLNRAVSPTPPTAPPSPPPPQTVEAGPQAKEVLWPGGCVKTKLPFIPSPDKPEINLLQMVSLDLLLLIFYN